MAYSDKERYLRTVISKQLGVVAKVDGPSGCGSCQKGSELGPRRKDEESTVLCSFNFLGKMKITQ